MPVILAVPVVDAVKVVLQVAVPDGVPAARVQVVNVPVTPATAKFTLPVGVLTGEVESVTVAVHVTPWLRKADEGQLTLVVVLCFTAAAVTVTLCVVLLVPPTLSVVVSVTTKVVVLVGLNM